MTSLPYPVAPSRQEFAYGKHTVVLETGHMARQATAAVTVTAGGTVVLVTVVAKKEPKPGQDFFPLTVDYQERFYAGGRIPGGFFKREGRPTEAETLTSRLIDRPLRPLFPEGFFNEIQVIATVLSLDPEVPGEIPALIGSSAAMALAGVPFAGPIGAAKVGYVKGQYVLNPSDTELLGSDLELIVAGTRDAVLMVESEAKMLSEEVMLGAVLFGHAQMQAAIKAIDALVAQAGKAKWTFTAPDTSELDAAVAPAMPAVEAAYGITEKPARRAKLDEARQALYAQLSAGDAPRFDTLKVREAFHNLEYKAVRERVLSGAPRIDGRDRFTVRPLTIGVGILPRTHGSALFTRGETQVMAVVTLGSGKEAQLIDAAGGESDEPFMFNYNFQPFCVNETGRLNAPKRREIGHGRLAKRGVLASMPKLGSEFPYVVRVVCETLESNGSSSMASVCSASLALMDAGVPVKAPVAGVAMGLIKEGERWAVLTDILGDEDHLGDMDFKVAGSADGISALQMDIKIEGITPEIMQVALEQARTARLHILGAMGAVLAKPRTEMSAFAPRITTIKIHPDKIREVIGKGGSVIQALTKETGTTIDIDDDGTIRIAATSGSAAQLAIARIEAITKDIEPGALYDGRVAKITDFGAFVTIAPGKDGLVHISQLADRRVERVADVVKEGDTVRVRVLEVARDGKIRLSMRPGDLD